MLFWFVSCLVIYWVCVEIPPKAFLTEIRTRVQDPQKDSLFPVPEAQGDKNKIRRAVPMYSEEPGLATAHSVK